MATKTIVDTDSTQTLTNKTLTAPVIATISNTGTITVPNGPDTLVGRATTDTLTNKTLTTPSITNPAVTSGTFSSPTLTSPTMTTPTINSAQVPSVSGTAPLYLARAWVNFNGSTAAINASGNVSSITKNSTGDYTINFTTAMPDANYGVGGLRQRVGADNNAAPGLGVSGITAPSASAFRIFTPDVNSTAYAMVDPTTVCVSVFR